MAHHRGLLSVKKTKCNFFLYILKQCLKIRVQAQLEVPVSGFGGARYDLIKAQGCPEHEAPSKGSGSELIFEAPKRRTTQKINRVFSVCVRFVFCTESIF